MTAKKTKSSKFPVQINFKIKKSHLFIEVKYQPTFFIAIFFGLLGALIFAFTPSMFSSLTSFFRPEPTPVISSLPALNFSPSRIVIPDIDLDLPIKSATVSANDWQVYDDAVSHLNTSGDLAKGNIVLYAHNQKNAFGKIIQMGIGNLITLRSTKGDKQFKVTNIFTATPQDIHLLENTDDNILTMYTCSGWFDRDRFFVIAKPVK